MRGVAGRWAAMLGLGVLLVTPLVQASSVALPALEEKVRHELASLPYYNVFDDLSFRVDGGTVTLFGEVTQLVLKSDAENVVKNIEGVTRVDNQIEVLPVSFTDDQIRMRVYRAIFSQAGLERYAMGVIPSIRIIVKNGDVKLVGVVNTDMDRQLAYTRANQVPGVFAVTNDLKVEK